MSYLRLCIVHRARAHHTPAPPPPLVSRPTRRQPFHKAPAHTSDAGPPRWRTCATSAVVAPRTWRLAALRRRGALGRRGVAYPRPRCSLCTWLAVTYGRHVRPDSRDGASDPPLCRRQRSDAGARSPHLSCHSDMLAHTCRRPRSENRGCASERLALCRVRRARCGEPAQRCGRSFRGGALC